MAETHSSALAHQFDDLDQQFEASQLGMWAFLVTEILFFGGLFLGYAVYRSQYPEAFAAASQLLDWKLGMFNTAVLIGSSFTMAQAVHAAQIGKRRQLIVYLLLTILLGSVFLGVKVVEYSHKFHEHLVPGPGFHFEGVDPQHVQLFFSFYFAMTGMHALHMIIGLGILIYLVLQSRRGRFSPEYYTPVDITGLYWHFVDIVWIFLFPFLYLISRTGGWNVGQLGVVTLGLLIIFYLAFRRRTSPYILVGVTLLLMTVLTVEASFLNLGFLNIYLAIAIATFKASLVLLFFMHLWYSPRLTWVFALAGFIWLVLMIALTVADIFTRGWNPEPPGWTPVGGG